MNISLTVDLPHTNKSMVEIYNDVTQAEQNILEYRKTQILSSIITKLNRSYPDQYWTCFIDLNLDLVIIGTRNEMNQYNFFSMHNMVLGGFNPYLRCKCYFFHKLYIHTQRIYAHMYMSYIYIYIYIYIWLSFLNYILKG